MTTSEFFIDKDYGSNYFIGGKITHQWIVECLDKNDNKFQKYRGNNKIKMINGIDISDGKGFISKVFKTDIQFDDEKKEPYSIVIKIPCENAIKEILLKENIDDNLDEDFRNDYIAFIHNRECFFYSNFASKIRFLKYPKCFGSKELKIGRQTGALILQFMGSNSKTVSFFRFLNIYQTKSILNEIFKLQEYSLLDSNNSWKGIFKQPFFSSQFKKIEYYIKMGFLNIKSYTSKEMWLDIEKDLDILISNYVTIAKYVYYQLPTLKNNLPVITHGDMWINNFMFEIDSNGDCSNILSAVIDWQTIHEGSIGGDISRILATSVPTDVRKEIEKYYFPDYYKKLKKSLINNGKEMVISYETFINNYKTCFIQQSLMAFITFGFGLKKYNVPNDSDYIWDARKYYLGSKVFHNIYDSIKFCNELHPEWLEFNE
ncbi:Protein kinase-like domain and Uncharacterised oxidoreductase Dhs-27 family and CHK kinase-like domain-containing protein [Strongyloides ratti]|uniref:Protein kinase-like domain and Uncharacterized oxidoreductase Dhs-27 family and CHK kinase-like domain-containing protein n=1 Tax=Strongyloides ratti TaxID=34506 RepID=A0A090LPT1_STRRB|nr:Protein kinase-like domain and Uncharacterised oxidoreductase Dhs-27 family and CHK kinase-like domain-containing protein [Strongyloides ratti]CEF69555.1 Protein kinase-like domain and Uncharacterised oxidoreductase Dhs-27 family and CHK kinase-like domain-containing protein [Strongyloides ratti]